MALSTAGDSSTYQTTGTAVWRAWTSVTNSTTTTANDLTAFGDVWQSWTSGTTSTYIYAAPADPPIVQPIVETQEQMQLRIAREAEERREYERKAREERQRKEAAQARAKALLLENLTTEEAEEYLQRQAFRIMAANGKRYEIRHGLAGNISELDEKGKHVARYCVAPEKAWSMPVEDTLLAQVLFLRSDPQALFAHANVTRLQ